MTSKRFAVLVGAAAAISCCATASAQFPVLVTDFETNGAGINYVTQLGSLGDLQVVLFQDPAEADATEAFILPDNLSTLGLGSPAIPSSEESFVATFAGFGGAFGTPNFLDIRFEWASSTNGQRWALVETLQSPTLGDPSVHLDGTVSFYINIPNCAQFEFPGQFTLPSQLGVALLISETGRAVPQGFQDNDVLNGSFEFVGVSTVAFADTANPVPVPTTFIPITDADCSGSGTGPADDWRLVTFDLSTANVVGWSFRGGDGVLDASTNGDNVNRGVLAGLVIAPMQSDTTSDFVELLVDQITLDAPVNDPTFAPSIQGPVIAGANSVDIIDVVARATNVILEIDRSDMDNEDPFVADETFQQDPALDPANELRFTTINVAPNLEIGDRLRARQVVGGNTSANSVVVAVNPPAAFSATLSLDEDGSLGTVAVFEWVGATTVIPSAGTQGKPIFPQNGVWQKLEYSLIPGVEPVISFAGGNGQLEPNGGLYNIDAMFFTIDSSDPQTGPYDIFVDHVFVIDANDNEVLISDAEALNPFPNFRGQSTSTGNSSIISGLTSYDGINSNRIQWTFPDTAANNTCAPFRPAVTFADSAKSVGMWLLVEDTRTSGLQLPAIEQRVIGDPPMVTISNIDTNATDVELLVNGTPVGNVDPAGAATVNIAPSVSVSLGDSVSARYTMPDTSVSDLAYPRVSQRPAAPTVGGPLVEGQTAVIVSGISNTGNAVASLVSLFDGETLLDSIDPQGSASVQFILNPALVAGQQINATQTVNGAVSVASAPVGVGTGETICVVINEFQYDDSGTDDREFVELYNAEPTPVDISGWSLRSSDDIAPPGDNNPDYIITNGTVLAPGDYYVLGSALVANVDQVVGATNLWENDNEAIELLDSNGVVVDTVIYELNKGPVAVSPSEGGIWGNFTSIDATPQSLSRWLDGYDTDDNGRDFGMRPETPGASNNLAPLAKPFTDTFSGAAESDVPTWTGSFVNTRHIDPTAASASNPGPIPASPQGGNAAVCWDPAGGGNECALSDEARFDVAFSAQIYINADNVFNSNGLGSENETWSIGLGMTGTFHNSFAANGNTGLAWQFFKEEVADTGTMGVLSLQLINENNGGDDGVVLLDIPSNSITTGWHTISITRNYENWSASFDAISTSGVITNNGPSTLFAGYREFLLGVPATARPLTIDNLQITVPAAPTLGACCIDCGCSILTAATCSGTGGSYAGDGTDCTDADMNDIADSCEALAAPAPVVSSPICDGDVLVEVTGVVPEASLVTIYDAGVNPIATAIPGGASTVRVHISPPLMTGQEISATQDVGSFESSQSNQVTVTECPQAFCVSLFEDDFDTDTSANWLVNTSGADTAFAFAYDYSADSIPPSPNGSGSTMGLKMEANLAVASTDFVVASPIGVSPTSNYQVTVDFWMNYALGDGASTEFLGAGVGHDGVTAERDGSLFIFSGDGGSGSDYRFYKDSDQMVITTPDEGPQYTIASLNNIDPAISAAFPGQSPPAGQGQGAGTAPNGTVSFGWHTMTITVDTEFETVNFKIDDFNFGTLVCGGELGATCDVGGALQLFYGDIFTSVTTQTALTFGLFDNFRVVAEQPAGVTEGDWDGDGDSDLDDYLAYADCMAGPDVSPDPTSAECVQSCLDAFDTDADNDVDLEDFHNLAVLGEFTD